MVREHKSMLVYFAKNFFHSEGLWLEFLKAEKEIEMYSWQNMRDIY